jgi:hypothetical protein
MKHARTSLVALAGAIALAGTFALGSIPARAASGGTPASASTRLVNTHELTQLKPDRPGVTPDVEMPELCLGTADKPDFSSGNIAITSAAYINECTAKPVSCTVSAHLQGESADSGGWVNIAIGPNATGCTSAHASIISVPCERSNITWTYRTEGVYKVVWPDGGVDEDSNVSPTASGAFSCSPED